MIFEQHHREEQPLRAQMVSYVDKLYEEVRSIMLDKGISHEQAVQEFLDELRRVPI
jgi:hypothetical protein